MLGVPGVTLALELAADGLASHYRGVEGPSREAAEQYVHAEERLEVGDWSLGLRSAAAALHGFRACRDEDGVADALRLVIVGHRVRAEALRYGGGAAASGAGDVLKQAEQLAKEEAQNFREAGNKRGEGFMLLAAAEVNYNRRGAKKRGEAKQMATKATELSWDIGDQRLEAAAAWVILHAVYKNGQPAQMLVQAQVALELFRAVGDVRGQAKTLHMLGIARLFQCDFDSALASMTSASELLCKAGARRIQAIVMFGIAQVHCTRSSGAEAARWAEEALDLVEKYDEGANPGWKAAIEELLVKALAIKGDHQTAMLVAERALRPFASISDKRGEAIAARAKGTLHAIEGNWEDAVDSYEESHALVQNFGDAEWKASSRFSMAAAHLRNGDSWSASWNAKEAAELFGELQDDHNQALARVVEARALLLKGDLAKARELASAQKEILRNLGMERDEAECLLVLASCHLHEDEVDKAVELAEEGREKFGDVADWLIAARFLFALTKLYVHAGRNEKAIALAKELRCGWRRFGNPAAEAEALRFLAHLFVEQGRGREAVRAAGMALTAGRRSKDRKCLIEMLLFVAQTNMNVYACNVTLHGTPNLSRILTPNALKPAKQALSLAKANGLTLHGGSALYMVGAVSQALGHSGPALENMQEAILTFRQTRDRSSEAVCTIFLARIHAECEQSSQAVEAARQAVDLAREVDDSKTWQEAEELLLELLGPSHSRPAAAPPEGAWAPDGPAGPGEAPAQAGAAAASSAVQPKATGLELAVVVKTVQEMAKAAIGLDEDLSMDSPLMDSGLDSLSAVSFRNGLASHLGVKLPSSLMFDYPTMRQVADKVVQVSMAE